MLRVRDTILTKNVFKQSYRLGSNLGTRTHNQPVRTPVVLSRPLQAPGVLDQHLIDDGEVGELTKSELPSRPTSLVYSEYAAPHGSIFNYCSNIMHQQPTRSIVCLTFDVSYRDCNRLGETSRCNFKADRRCKQEVWISVCYCHSR